MASLPVSLPACCIVEPSWGFRAQMPFSTEHTIYCHFPQETAFSYLHMLIILSLLSFSFWTYFPIPANRVTMDTQVPTRAKFRSIEKINNRSSCGLWFHLKPCTFLLSPIIHLQPTSLPLEWEDFPATWIKSAYCCLRHFTPRLSLKVALLPVKSYSYLNPFCLPRTHFLQDVFTLLLWMLWGLSSMSHMVQSALNLHGLFSAEQRQKEGKVLTCL